MSNFKVGADEFVVLSFRTDPWTLPRLTAAERQVVTLMLEGKSNKEIAELRQTSPRTVANQLAAIFKKVGVGSRSALAASLARKR